MIDLHGLSVVPTDILLHRRHVTRVSELTNESLLTPTAVVLMMRKLPNSDSVHITLNVVQYPRVTYYYRDISSSTVFTGQSVLKPGARIKLFASKMFRLS